MERPIRDRISNWPGHIHVERQGRQSPSRNCPCPPSIQALLGQKRTTRKGKYTSCSYKQITKSDTEDEQSPLIGRGEGVMISHLEIIISGKFQPNFIQFSASFPEHLSTVPAYVAARARPSFKRTHTRTPF